MIPLTNEQELQRFYNEHFDQSSEIIKSVVEDLQARDCESALN